MCVRWTGVRVDAREGTRENIVCRASVGLQRDTKRSLGRGQGGRFVTVSFFSMFFLADFYRRRHRPVARGRGPEQRKQKVGKFEKGGGRGGG